MAKRRPSSDGMVRRRDDGRWEGRIVIGHKKNGDPIFHHDLRHTFATLALQGGMDIKTLSAMLGHVSAATTLDIYTHITDDMQRQAAANIDRGIGKVGAPENDPEPGQETAPGRS